MKLRELHTTFLLFASTLLLSLWGCTVGEAPVADQEIPDQPVGVEQMPGEFFEGMIRVKLSPEVGNELADEENVNLRSTGSGAMDDYLSEIGAKSMTRLFPNTGKYEERKRREGLHLWYTITFDDSLSLTNALTMAQQVEGVEIVEASRKIPVPNNTIIPLSPSDVASLRAASEMPFDDPLLPGQWHYHNEGKFIRHKADADANIFEAWKEETGKPNVVVAVVDGGVDFEHEDLAGSVYEENRGYNFVLHTDQINPVEHGTHVAGTVAARNNNGVGVAGVAGGNGDPDSGIRLMSCQVFDVDKNTNKTKQAANFGEALVYAADNGAVIAQNSWGYNYPGPGALDAATKDAIDYFIKYAGCDENGKQLPDSPMKGGVVIFAAGNDGKDFLSYPGAYDPVVAVSAMGPDFKRAPYTNRGAWIDIMAPGGNSDLENGGVLSTLPRDKRSKESRYGYMSGTSMACPHVSGIAALIVSKFGGPGFTNEELQMRLENSLRQENIYEYNSEVGRLGNGYIDAAVALQPKSDQLPKPVTDVATGVGYSEVQLSFIVEASDDEITPSFYRLYVSESEIKAKELPDMTPVIIPAHNYKSGDRIDYTVSGLDFWTKYHFAIVAVDRWAQTSDPYFFKVTTKANAAPVLTLEEGVLPLRLSAEESKSFLLKVTDAEGQPWTYEVTGESRGVSYDRTDEGIRFHIKGTAPVGQHKIHVRVEDYYFHSAEIDIPFEVYVNHPPKSVKPFETLYVSYTAEAPTELDLSGYFADEDGDALTYSVIANDPQLLSASVNGSILSLKATGGEGTTLLTVTASDGAGHSALAQVTVRMVEDDFVYAVYPVPVTTTLHLIVSERVSRISIEVKTTDGIPALEQEMTFDETSSRHALLSVEKLPIGTYVLTVTSDTDSYQTTFVKI